MGRVDWPPGGTVYLDTNVFVYFVEDIAPHAGSARELFENADAGNVTLFTSILTLAELLVQPLRAGHVELAGIYRRLLLEPRAGLRVVALDASILEGAAGLRAGSASLRLPDALHLATARDTGCNAVVTNDARWKRAAAGVVLMSELQPWRRFLPAKTDPQARATGPCRFAA